MKDKVRAKIKDWKDVYSKKTNELTQFDKDLSMNCNLIEYNMKCLQAMALHECIVDLMEVLDA